MDAQRVTRRIAAGLAAMLAVALLALAPAASARPGDVYVLDRDAAGGRGAVLEIDPDDGGQTVLSTGGMLAAPTAIATGPDGSVYVTNAGDASVLRIDPETGEQATIHRGAPLVSPRGIQVSGTKRKPAIRVIDAEAEPQPLEGFGTGNIFNGTGSGAFRPYELDYVEAPFVEMTALQGGWILDRGAGEAGTGALYFVGETCYEGDTSISCEDGQDLDTEGGQFVDPVGLGYLGAGIGKIVVTDTGAAGPGKLITVSGEQQLLASGGELVDPTDLALLPARGDRPPRALVTDPGAAGGNGALLSVDPFGGQQTPASAGGELRHPVGIAIDLQGCFGIKSSELTRIGSDESERIVADSSEKQAVNAYAGDDEVELPTAPEPGSIHDACGGDGDDSLAGSSGPDTLAGGNGNDRAAGGAEDDFLLGSKGKDVLLGKGGFDFLAGGPGPDRVKGGEGAGSVSGGPGGDVLVGGSGRETFEGANGRDLIKAADGGRRVRDRIECGRGRDKVIADRKDEVERDCERVKRRR